MSGCRILDAGYLTGGIQVHHVFFFPSFLPRIRDFRLKTACLNFNRNATKKAIPVSLTRKSPHMKRITLSIIICCVIGLSARSQAYEGKIDYDKKKQSAFVIEFPYPPEAVENAIMQKMEKLGYKGKEEKGLFNKDKGFRVYKNAYITDISEKKFDYIIEVERKSRKEKDEAILYLVILDKDGENAIMGFDAADMHNAKSFLNRLQPDVEAANLELQIRDQEDIVAKAEKKLRDLEKAKTDLENKLKDNIKDQEDTSKDIENQKKVLESLKLKRKDSM